MTARERRLEAALVRKERELIEAERAACFYFSRWLAASRVQPDITERVAGFLRKYKKYADSLFRAGFGSLWHG